MPAQNLEKLTLQQRRESAKNARTEAEDKPNSVRVILRLGDARELSWLPDESVHLAVTSPPYWTLKRYNVNSNQLGHIREYEKFWMSSIWSGGMSIGFLFQGEGLSALLAMFVYLGARTAVMS